MKYSIFIFAAVILSSCGTQSSLVDDLYYDASQDTYLTQVEPRNRIIVPSPGSGDNSGGSMCPGNSSQGSLINSSINRNPIYQMNQSVNQINNISNSITNISNSFNSLGNSLGIKRRSFTQRKP